MSEHTPGPWTATKQTERCTYIAANTKIADVYSTAFRDFENEAANARLIAAAPELLAALKALLEACYAADAAEELDERVHGGLMDAARDAIAAAERADHARRCGGCRKAEPDVKFTLCPSGSGSLCDDCTPF